MLNDGTLVLRNQPMKDLANGLRLARDRETAQGTWA
jgi:hypothetical protein